jgi:hypothetical protein
MDRVHVRGEDDRRRAAVRALPARPDVADRISRHRQPELLEFLADVGRPLLFMRRLRRDLGDRDPLGDLLRELLIDVGERLLDVGAIGNSPA